MIIWFKVMTAHLKEKKFLSKQLKKGRTYGQNGQRASYNHKRAGKIHNARR